MCNPSRARSYRVQPIATPAKNQFKIGTLNEKNENGANFFYLDADGQNFQEFRSRDTIFNDATAGIFTIEENDQHSIISYDATKQTRFLFYIAVKYGTEWEISLQGIHSKNGIALHAIQPQFQPLTEFLNLNTALVLGLEPNSSKLKLQMKATDVGVS